MPSPVKVIGKSGPTLTMIINGHRTTRNVRDVKKVPQEEVYDDIEIHNEVLAENAAEESNAPEATRNEEVKGRPVRQKKPPERLKDYILE